MIAVVLGATGLVGSRLLRLLLDDETVQRVYAPSRRPLPVHPKLVVLPADPESLPPDLADAEVFCALGTTRAKAGSAAAFRAVDQELVLAFGRAAAARGASCFVLVSSQGANASSPFLYPRVKGEVERELSGLGFARLVIGRPGLLLGERAERRPAEALAQWLLAKLEFLLRGRWRRYRPIEAAAVARGLLRAARAPGRGPAIVESEALQDLGG